MDPQVHGIDQLRSAYQTTRGGESTDYRRALPHFWAAAKLIETFPLVLAAATLWQYSLSIFRIAGGSFPDDLAKLSDAETSDLVSVLEQLERRYSELPREAQEVLDIPGGASLIHSDLSKVRHEAERRNTARRVSKAAALSNISEQAAKQAAKAILEDVEQRLRNFKLEGAGVANLHSGIIEDFRFERQMAEDRARDEWWRNKIGRLMAECERAEGKLQGISEANEIVGSLKFTQGRLYSILGQWKEAQKCFEMAIEAAAFGPPVAIAQSDAKARYYLALTYDFDGGQADMALQQLKRVIARGAITPSRYKNALVQIDLISTPPPKDTKTAARCFIVTSASGDMNSPEVVFLSNFRDQVLLRSSVGRVFNLVYSDVSPLAARMIDKSPVLRCLTLMLLVRPTIEVLRTIWRNRARITDRSSRPG